MGDKFSKSQESYADWMKQNCTPISYKQYEELSYNKMPIEKLRKALIQNGRVNESDTYICGMHALNMCWLMLGYQKDNQWTKSQYPFKNLFSLKWGLSSEEFERVLIKPYFKSYDYYCGDSMPWHILKTNYSDHAVIILIGTSQKVTGLLHYIVVIAQSEDGKMFVVTDGSQKLYKISDTQLSLIMRIYTPSVCKYNAYQVG